jgi:hypothetical protein
VVALLEPEGPGAKGEESDGHGGHLLIKRLKPKSEQHIAG